MDEFPQGDFEAPLAQGEGEFPRALDGPSAQRELFGFPFSFPFPFPVGCSSQAKGDFPQDFKVPLDQGGPPHCSPRVPIGGFGGDRSKDRSGHRATVRSVGKAPIILIHGHTGVADSGQWAVTKLKDNLMMEAGYQRELLWAPSYLGTAPAVGGGGGGGFDTEFPHTNNVNEVREFIDNVCEYLGVKVVDIIAHSLGCTLAYSVLRGLRKQRTPVVFDEQLKRWPRVGTFVALAGAFRGLRSFDNEWAPGGDFMDKLLTEELVGGGDETPFKEGEQQTPGPVPHNITYFCGIAEGDSVDNDSPDLDRSTSMLEGANKVESYIFSGDGLLRHEKIITESEVIKGDDDKGLEGFARYLNSVPPVPRVAMNVDTDSGDHIAPLMITIDVKPPDKIVNYVADRVAKKFSNGYIVSKVTETLKGTFIGGQGKVTLPEGMWKVVYNVEGAVEDEKRTYWVGATEKIEATIEMDNSTPFEGNLNVTATSTRGKLYHSLYGRGQSEATPKENALRTVVHGEGWREGDVVRIDGDATVYFIAIDSDGTASEIVSKSFKKSR